MKRRKVIIDKTTPCGDTYGVTTLRIQNSTHLAHHNKPCEECPWRMDRPTGIFPPDAFHTSAPTAYDGAMNTFACHVSGLASVTCAGFLLRHDVHNIGVRMARATGLLPEALDVTDGGFPIYRTYREMAIANGVDPDEDVLKPIRGNNDDAWVDRSRREK